MSQPQKTPPPLLSISAPRAGFSEFYVHVPASVAAQDSDAELNNASASFETDVADYFRIKTAIDRLITAILTVIALPLVLVVSLAILLLDGRPVFYRQVRLGKKGREFWIWKFRTMRQNAESSTGAVWSSTSDPRVTPLGRWLRRCHLDELPQFLNILAGEMNLVGPRPERPEFARELAREIPNYMGRTAVRPGITGLAQLRLGYDHSVADVRKKVLLDLQYIRTAGFPLDVWLLACTMPYIAKQLFFKWIAGRRLGTPSSGTDEVESSRLVVAPSLRCDGPSDHRESDSRLHRGDSSTRDSRAAGDIPASVFPNIASMVHAEEECA